jgi:RIO kinase 1
VNSAFLGSDPGAERFTFVPTRELDSDQRWSRYDEPGVLSGPEPVPTWVITGEAIETELGVLKSGKEADVALIERAVPPELPGSDAEPVVLAAKRYRAADRRCFHRDTIYTESRQLRRSRDRRAVARNSSYGRSVEAAQWAMAEFETLCDLWSAGLPVPYPVQLDETEILMEFITTSDGGGAPRLVQVRPDHDQLVDYWQQLYRSMTVLAGRQQAHGDLSPYNILAEDDRLVIIDLPQVVDVVSNPYGMQMLARDCRNVCSWFTARGLPVDADDLLSDLVTFIW